MASVTHYLLKWDAVLFSYVIERTRKSHLNRLVWWISKSADGQAYPAILVLLIFLQFRQWKAMVAAFLVSFAFELPIYRMIKQWVRRARPFQEIQGVKRLIVPPDLFSFPSGHTAAAFVVAALIGHYHPPALPLVYLWASIVGFSRVYLGVHYPTDVVAGALLGSLSAKAGLLLSTSLFG
jgi:undecaprenyl-diphosphatase